MSTHVVEIEQLKDGETPAALSALDLEGRRFTYTPRGATLVVDLGDDGVVQLRRSAGPQSTAKPGPLVGGVAAGAIRTAHIKKGRGWPFGLVLGLLSGDTLEGAAGGAS